MSDAPRFTLTEQQLADRLVELRTEALKTAADIKQIKSDAKFHKDKNPTGIPAAEIALIDNAAKIEANANFDEFKEKTAAVTAKYNELYG
jgi:hypothetical protein